MVDPFVPMRGTPGCSRSLRCSGGARTMVPNAQSRCKGRCTCTRPNWTFLYQFLLISSVTFFTLVVRHVVCSCGSPLNPFHFCNRTSTARSVLVADCGPWRRLGRRTNVSAGESSGSVVRRMLLGSQLRRLREARGITREAAGYSIRASESKISRMELGRVSFKTRDVEDLLTLYGITDEAERTSLVSLAKEANVAGWWHSYSDVLPSWFPTYVGLEGAAHLIRSYEVQFVHGLLQTEAYARAVVRRGMKGASEA